MNISAFIIPILLILAGVCLKLSIFPNTRGNKKLGILLIVLGSLIIVLRIALYLVKK